MPERECATGEVGGYLDLDVGTLKFRVVQRVQRCAGILLLDEVLHIWKDNAMLRTERGRQKKLRSSAKHLWFDSRNTRAGSESSK